MINNCIYLSTIDFLNLTEILWSLHVRRIIKELLHSEYTFYFCVVFLLKE